MLILSHRGFHRAHKENTIEAFNAALKFGVDGIETDIRLTMDKVPILFHDRLSPNCFPINKISYKELIQEVGFQAPTLEEALRFNDKIFWNLEIKTPDSVEIVVPILRKFKLSHRIIITSFFHNVLSLFANKLNIDCGVLIAHQPIDTRSFVNKISSIDPQINTIVLPCEFLSEDNAAIIHNNDLNLFVYDVEIPEDFAKCRELAVEAVITNRPDLATVQV